MQTLLAISLCLETAFKFHYFIHASKSGKEFKRKKARI